jgi:hypothetical protein
MSKKPDKKTKRVAKTAARSPSAKKAAGSGELSEDELEQTSGGASDYLLQLDGIKGESQAHKHKETIELNSFSFGGVGNYKVKLPR